ncbi:MAG: ATP-dependent DNA helicase RecG [Patescibacteria group bacterium]|jgi:ATP-dependent DNA helicase RecG
MISLDSNITELNRVGKTTSKLLKKLGLETVHDLLFYFPFRYDDFASVSTIAELKANENTHVIGTIELIQNKKSFKRRMFITEALVTDDSGSLKVIWFNQPFLTRTFKPGDKISLAGKVTEDYSGLSMITPVAEKMYSESLIHTKGLIPNYHLTENLTQKQIRYLVKEVITLADKIEDWIPVNVKKRLELLDLGPALHLIHFPKSHEEITTARKRLGFAELFLRQLKSAMIKGDLKNRRALSIDFKEKETKEFVASLPFKLTGAQKKTAWEILRDLEKPIPMSRLLEGDVGSGKTLVVALALLNVALNNKRSVLMVPTEILASQHFNYLTKLFKDYGFKIALLTHSHKDSESNKADIIVGTHALIQENVKFQDLALAVVDEQHRFGVGQRRKILDFNSVPDQTPHFLSLTATPIPRSLALTIYGDLDLSIINEMPVGRKPVITKIVTEANRSQAYDFIRKQISSGRQAFVVCPLIDESDRLGVKSVKTEHERLDKEIFPELKVGLLHGRLKAKEKEDIMADFLSNKIQILVATAVIEVGVDVPNASLMIIEGAERFGLAQLHQFRGRVGRGEAQSYCLLFPSSEEITNPKTITRLNAMNSHNDGLTLAKIDLKLRGAGELYGLNQSGFPEFQIATLFDYENIKKAQEEARALIAEDPELKKYPLLKEKLGKWEDDAHLE